MKIFCENLLLGATRFELKSVRAVVCSRDDVTYICSGFELIELPLLVAFPKYYLLYSMFWEKTGGLLTLQSLGCLNVLF